MKLENLILCNCGASVDVETTYTKNRNWKATAKCACGHDHTVYHDNWMASLGKLFIVWSKHKYTTLVDTAVK